MKSLGEHLVRDLSLAPLGRLKIEWAKSRMRVLTNLFEEIGKERPLEGVKVGICLHLEAKTAVLASLIEKSGAKVAITSSNPLTTQDDVAAALTEEVSHVYSWRGETLEEYEENLNRVLDFGPDLLIDDGADLIVKAHVRGIEGIFGATEETSSGVVRLKAMEGEGILKCPAIAVNDAKSKFLFDNRFGSGQSVIDGIMRATNVMLGGKDVVVIGFGWVGRGIAERLRGMGARVTVTEVDPFRAMEAYFEGFKVSNLEDASKYGDIFITATGNINVVTEKHFALMKDCALLANAGHFDVEVDVRGLERVSEKRREVRPGIKEYQMGDGRRIYLISEGRLVNLAAADGHPIEIMDLSFSLQYLSLIYLHRNRGRLKLKVYSVPDEVDRKVVETKLLTEGIRIDKLTEEQIRYLERWR